MPGVQFDEAYERRVEVQFDDVPIAINAKQDLIAAKRAAGRPQDLLDADSLEQTLD